LFVLLHAEETNHGVVRVFVHIKTAKSDIRQVSLTTML